MIATDVAGLLRLDNREACAITLELAAQKVALIEQKLAQLRTIRDALAKLVFIPTVVVPPLLVTHGPVFWLLLRSKAS